MTNITATQIAAIRARAVNTVTRAIAYTGLSLTHAQADELGAEAIQWLCTRFGLRATETDRGVEIK